MKVLFVGANPVNTKALDLRGEFEQIQRKLNESARGGLFEFHALFDPGVDAFERELQRRRPDIVHFSGHASVHGLLMARTAQSPAHVVPKDAFGQLFRLLGYRVRCVVLNACASLPSAEMLTDSVDCAIGMKAPILDQDAIDFAASFYRALAFGKTVAEAVEKGINTVRLHGAADFALPAIVCRSGMQCSAIRLHATLWAYFLHAPVDAGGLERLLVRLKPLRRIGVLDWRDPEELALAPNPHVAAAEARAMAPIQVALLSADFFGSDELTRQLEDAYLGQQEGKVRLIPIRLHPTTLPRGMLADLATLPRHFPDITTAAHVDAAWKDVADDVERIITQVQSQRSSE